jgi:hypothetical protein
VCHTVLQSLVNRKRNIYLINNNVWPVKSSVRLRDAIRSDAKPASCVADWKIVTKVGVAPVVACFEKCV